MHNVRVVSSATAQALAARLASRLRRCYVCENIDPGYHLLLVDDDGGLILAERLDDWEIAVWLATLVNQELAKQGALL